MKCLPGEANWFNDIQRSAAKYSIIIDEEKIKSVSKETFKGIVKAAIQNYAFKELKEECSSQTKTGTLTYDEFKCQSYMSKLYPSHAKTSSEMSFEVFRYQDPSTFPLQGQALSLVQSGRGDTVPHC